MKTEYDADAAFLFSLSGEQERRIFYTLMLRSRGERNTSYILSMAFCKVVIRYAAIDAWRWGQSIILTDGELAAALLLLPEKKREVIGLYFLHI